MMKEGQIEHYGVVERVGFQSLDVSVMREAACSACAAAQLCHSSDKERRIINVHVLDADKYRQGQEVTIIGETSWGLWAIGLAYALPLVLLLMVLMIVSHMAANEGRGGLAALLVLVPYYLILYLLRNRLQRKFLFRIKT